MSEVDDVDEPREHEIQHLVDILGNVNYSQAKVLLEENSWDLERTVNLYMNFDDSTLRRRTTSNPQVELSPNNQQVHTASVQPQGWLWFTYNIFIQPIKFGYHLILGFMRFFVSFIWTDSRTQITDPLGDVNRFIQNYSTNYLLSNETGQVPPFFEGTYADALKEAKQKLCFLVVYLHGDNHEHTDKFCRDTLQSSEFITFLKESNDIIFWGCNINSPEGYRVSRTLREHSYPFIGVIGLTVMQSLENGPYSSTVTRMALVGRLEGLLGPTELITQLKKVLHQHQGPTEMARQDRADRELTAQLRREQDQAYEMALAEDRAKAAARAAEKNSANQQAMEAEAHIARQLYWRQCLPSPPSPDAGSTVSLLFKLPDGSKSSRRFTTTDSVKIAYYYILTLNNSPMNFQLETSYPRRIIECKPSNEPNICDYLKMANEPVTEIDNWAPENESDPSSFVEFGLTKPETLHVVDLDN